MFADSRRGVAGLGRRAERTAVTQLAPGPLGLAAALTTLAEKPKELEQRGDIIWLL